MPVNQFTPGINLPSGFQVANPFPVDSYLGPYPGGTTTAARNSANDTITPANRYQGMQVILLAPDGGATVAYKYWYRGGTANENLVEFSAGGAGLDTSNTYTWTAHQNFSAGFSAAGGVTFTSLTHFTAGLSASGATLGALVVNNGISAAGGVTFNSLVWFPQGLSAADATLGALVVNGGISANSGATFANNVHVGGTLSVDGNFYVAGTMTTVNESQLLI